ncbi:transcription termination factor mterf5 [Quercus suber]|uniref:Transcription termination factor mterf5 n=1 Tax=Quercus suber TaxID=58331 RepID=A0AAW0LKA6_QUESU
MLVISFLEGLGIDKETIGRIICRCPEIFATSIEKTIKRKLEFLTSIDVSGAQVPRDTALMVRKFSPLLGYSIDEVLRPKAEFLVNTMEKPITDVVDYPSLKDMLGKYDDDFAANYMGVGSMLVTSPIAKQ